MIGMRRRSKLIVVGGGGFEGDVSGGPNEIRPKGEGGMSFTSPFSFVIPPCLPPLFPIPLTLTSVCVLITVSPRCVMHMNKYRNCCSGKECCENEHKGSFA